MHTVNPCTLSSVSLNHCVFPSCTVKYYILALRAWGGGVGSKLSIATALGLPPPRIWALIHTSPQM